MYRPHFVYPFIHLWVPSAVVDDATMSMHVLISLHDAAFIFLTFIMISFYLEDNCFTMLCRFLP